MANATSFTRTNPITLPLLSFKKIETVFVRCEGEIFKGKELTEVDSDTGQKVKKKPANLMHVTNLETGILMEMIVPVLVASSLIEKMEGNYVGKCLEIFVSHKPKEGKKYKTCEIYEITDPSSKNEVK